MALNEFAIASLGDIERVAYDHLNENRKNKLHTKERLCQISCKYDYLNESTSFFFPGYIIEEIIDLLFCSLPSNIQPWLEVRNFPTKFDSRKKKMIVGCPKSKRGEIAHIMCGFSIMYMR